MTFFFVSDSVKSTVQPVNHDPSGLELAAQGSKITRGEAVIAVILTRRSLAIRPYCEVKGASCTWLGMPAQGDLIKSAIMKTYLAAHIG